MTDVRLDTFFGEDLRSLNANELVILGHAIVRDIFATLPDLCLPLSLRITSRLSAG